MRLCGFIHEYVEVKTDLKVQLFVDGFPLVSDPPQSIFLSRSHPQSGRWRKRMRGGFSAGTLFSSQGARGLTDGPFHLFREFVPAPLGKQKRRRGHRRVVEHLVFPNQAASRRLPCVHFGRFSKRSKRMPTYAPQRDYINLTGRRRREQHSRAHTEVARRRTKR